MVRTSHVQLKLCINDLKILKFTLKEAIISCSHRADVSENQSQTLIVLLAESQHKLNS